MFETARCRSMRFLAAALLALTTVIVGFAHRPLRLEPRGYPSDVTAWTLPDGTLPELCHWDDVGGHAHGSGDATASCDACRLTDAPGLGAVAAIGLAVPSGIVLARLGHDTPALVDGHRPSPRSRGPPPTFGA